MNGHVFLPTRMTSWWIEHSDRKFIRLLFATAFTCQSTFANNIQETTLLCFSNLVSNEVWYEVTEENNLSTVLLSKTKHRPLSCCWFNILVLFVYFHYFPLYSILQMLVLIFIWSYMGFCWIGASCMLGKLKILLLQNVRRLYLEIRQKGNPGLDLIT